MASKRVLDVRRLTHVSRLVKSLEIAMSQENTAKLPDGQFGFSAVIETKNTRLSINTVDFTYTIPFDDDIVPNEAEFKIYNLSDQTLSNFGKNEIITVTAGYGDDTGIIFVGAISNVKTEPDGVDKATIINALDGFNLQSSDDVQLSFAEGTAASYILKTLLDGVGLAIEVFTVGRDYTYNKSVTVSGARSEQIKKYAEVCGVIVWVNKQRIYCRPLFDGDNIHFTVSAETGMIDSPKAFTETMKSEIYNDTISGYDVSMLAQHRMTAGAIVDIDSKYVSGSFRVKCGTHSYDGLSATTKIHAVESISTLIVPEESDDEYLPAGLSNSDTVDKAVEWAVGIANDDSHAYVSGGWGPGYDCSHFVITAYQQAGVPVKDGGATYTGNMLDVFLKNNFKNVTSSCKLSTGAGMKRGDVLLNVQHHTALVQEDGGKIVHASSVATGIVANRSYYNYPWDYVLRYNDPNAASKSGNWVKGHTATTYGYRGDDNGICGWNGINYHNVKGCHVAIPTYCVKQANCYNSAWAKQDFPELANGYGTVLEIRSPETGKTVKAVAADSGNFGPHNTYNHNTALDLPPNTYKALGLGESTYEIEYRVVGYVDSWNGEQL